MFILASVLSGPATSVREPPVYRPFAQTSEALADYGVEAILRLVLSGVLMWTALACLGAGFLGTVIRRRDPL